MLKVAILDDYAGVALASANWSVLDDIAEITVFREHLGEEQAIAALRPFDIVCTVRERMALPRRLFERLPSSSSSPSSGRVSPISIWTPLPIMAS